MNKFKESLIKYYDILLQDEEFLKELRSGDYYDQELIKELEEYKKSLDNE